MRYDQMRLEGLRSVAPSVSRIIATVTDNVRFFSPVNLKRRAYHETLGRISRESTYVKKKENIAR